MTCSAFGIERSIATLSVMSRRSPAVKHHSSVPRSVRPYLPLFSNSRRRAAPGPAAATRGSLDPSLARSLVHVMRACQMAVGRRAVG